MFQVGDRIEVDRAHGRKVRAVILEVLYSNATYRAKVRREDNQQEDVFIWNIFQDEISVRKIEPSPTVTMTLEEFDQKIEAARASGYRSGWDDHEERKHW